MVAPVTAFIPISQQQIAVANQMWNELPGWQSYDAALALAAETYPSNTEPRAVLIKAALLDRLYATNVYELPAAADRIVEVFSSVPVLSGYEIVVSLSQVGARRLVSFASKYAHFFYEKHLPLTDYYAIYALTRHFRVPLARVEDWTRDYPQYCLKLSELKRASQLAVTSREMDHYLWLAGNWITFQLQGPRATINKELKRYFGNPECEQRLSDAFGALLP